MRAAELGVNGDGRCGREVVDLGTTPVVCAQVLCLPICARNSGSPKRSGCCRSGGGLQKSRNRQNRHARCAALAQISESGLREREQKRRLC